jgi:hypothetical protein
VAGFARALTLSPDTLTAAIGDSTA